MSRTCTLGQRGRKQRTTTLDRPSTLRGTARTTLPMCAGVRTPRHPERTANMLSGSTPEKSPTSSPEEPFGLYEGIDVGCGSGLILRRARRAAFQDVVVRITDFRASALALRRSLREERPSRCPGPALWDSAADRKTARTASPRPPQRRATYTPDRPSTLRGTARTTLPMCAGVRTPRHPERTANMLSGSTPEKSPTSSPEEPFGLYEGIDVGCGSGLILRRARSAAFQDVVVRITDFRASALALRRSLREERPSRCPGPALWDSAADRKTARTASPRPPQRRATYTPDRPSTPRGRAQTTLPMCARVRTLRHPERYTNMLPGSTPEKSPTSSPKEPSGKEKTGWKTAMYGAPRRGLPAKTHARIQRRTT